MVVLVIIGLLAGVVGQSLLGSMDRANTSAAQTQIKNLRGALLTYRMDIGRFPSTDEGLAALTASPAGASSFWQGPYLDDEVPLDPWNNAYRYQFPADTPQGFALYSLGADAAEGGEDINADIGYLPQR